MAQRVESSAVSDADRTMAAVSNLPSEVLRPLLEGARARGMADALELIGVAAVLIDAAGMVLHVGGNATARMRGLVAVASRHLVGTDPASNRALQDVVAAATAGETRTATLKTPTMEELSIRAFPMPSDWDNPYQLMKAIIVFDDAPKPIDEPTVGS
jgi:hypothetical protein